MEGDPIAAPSYWRLAQITGGSFPIASRGLAMKKGRREIEGIAYLFLDVISCGFGAIILLLVLTKVFEPIVIEESIDNLGGYLATLEQDL